MSKDTIYRQDAIELALEYFVKYLGGAFDENGQKELMARFQRLSSARPERQRGRWIEYIPEHGKCPFCGNQIDLLNGKANNFCGECGADMRGKQE